MNHWISEIFIASLIFWLQVKGLEPSFQVPVNRFISIVSSNLNRYFIDVIGYSAAVSSEVNNDIFLLQLVSRFNAFQISPVFYL